MRSTQWISLSKCDVTIKDSVQDKMEKLNHSTYLMAWYQAKRIKYAEFDYLEGCSGKFFMGKLLNNKEFNCFWCSLYSQNISKHLILKSCATVTGSDGIPERANVSLYLLLISRLIPIPYQSQIIIINQQHSFAFLSQNEQYKMVIIDFKGCGISSWWDPTPLMGSH